MDRNDSLYQDLHQGFITGNSNGAEALWELLFYLIYAILVVALCILYAIVWTGKQIFLFVRWLIRGRP